MLCYCVAGLRRHTDWRTPRTVAGAAIAGDVAAAGGSAVAVVVQTRRPDSGLVGTSVNAGPVAVGSAIVVVAVADCVADVVAEYGVAVADGVVAVVAIVAVGYAEL